ncbi:ImmA/IrrE family metallo-endopeptidase [Staphylococcus agnetis]|uniref:ImmA/IrrE family metallo-endopeptidase n=1 Tax=Staphylococcus agnetis TaxID=985762 RepID=UPI0021D1B494|nr:ImmA/IrrE family metallo-endopeptidase [Staphylococcus agnetis]UXU67435.1 ImmA/IrrE family metallo-endopeptidase [Staphylococcus agnetis]
MGRYEELVDSYKGQIYETDKLPYGFDGWYQNGDIYIRRSLSTYVKHQVVAEEIAHGKLTYGNILNQKDFNNRKFENYAKRAAHEMIITLDGIIKAFKQGVHNLYELANFFEVTECYALECIEHYKRKFGLKKLHGDYMIHFEPLRVFEIKNIN